LTSGRAEARARFLGELRQSVTSLQDLLAVDDAKQAPASADRVAASLGTDGARFLSVSRLMAVFARRPDKPAVMDAERRRRCEGALAILEAAVRRQQESPAFRLFDGEQIDDPCTAALEFCDAQLRDSCPYFGRCASRGWKQSRLTMRRFTMRLWSASTGKLPRLTRLPL
jgi:hypothetical protein